MATVPAIPALGILCDATRIPLSTLVASALDQLAPDEPTPRRRRPDQATLSRKVAARVAGWLGYSVESFRAPFNGGGLRVVLHVDGEVVTGDLAQPYTTEAPSLARLGDAITALVAELRYDVDQLVDEATTDTSDERLRRDHPREL